MKNPQHNRESWKCLKFQGWKGRNFARDGRFAFYTWSPTSSHDFGQVLLSRSGFWCFGFNQRALKCVLCKPMGQYGWETEGYRLATLYPNTLDLLDPEHRVVAPSGVCYWAPSLCRLSFGCVTSFPILPLWECQIQNKNTLTSLLKRYKRGKEVSEQAKTLSEKI